jgi:hypothetical protein
MCYGKLFEHPGQCCCRTSAFKSRAPRRPNSAIHRALLKHRNEVPPWDKVWFWRPENYLERNTYSPLSKDRLSTKMWSNRTYFLILFLKRQCKNLRSDYLWSLHTRRSLDKEGEGQLNIVAIITSEGQTLEKESEQKQWAFFLWPQ